MHIIITMPFEVVIAECLGDLSLQISISSKFSAIVRYYADITPHKILPTLPTSNLELGTIMSRQYEARDIVV